MYVDRTTWEAGARAAPANEVKLDNQFYKNANTACLRNNFERSVIACLVSPPDRNRQASAAAPASVQTPEVPASATPFSSSSWTRSASWAWRRFTRGTSRREGWRCSSSSTLTDLFPSLLTGGSPPGAPGKLVRKCVLEAPGKGARLTLRP